MIYRCHNPNHVGYPKYGGRGVAVCARWRNSFDSFLVDVGQRPSPKHTLDRFPDQNGNYEPGNVRWATTVEQARNKGDNKVVEFRGRKQSLAAWADELGFNYFTLWSRIEKSGWSVERAFTTPLMH
jgi:hypothetical protein